MRRLKEKQQSLNAKMVQNTVPPKGLVLVLLVVVLMGLIINVANGKSPDTHNVMALYVLGDSSVDCGDNTLLYPLTHHNFSLHPCDGSDSSLLPYLLGTTFRDSSLACFIASYLGIICVFYSWGFEYVWMFLLELVFFKHRDNLQCLLQDYLFFAFLFSIRKIFYYHIFFQFIVKNHVKNLSNWWNESRYISESVYQVWKQPHYYIFLNN